MILAGGPCAFATGSGEHLEARVAVCQSSVIAATGSSLLSMYYVPRISAECWGFFFPPNNLQRQVLLSSPLCR